MVIEVKEHYEDNLSGPINSYRRYQPYPYFLLALPERLLAKDSNVRRNIDSRLRYPLHKAAEPRAIDADPSRVSEKL